MSYLDFIEGKSQIDEDHGHDPTFLPDFLFDFQRDLVKWSVRKGRAAIFADCGLGKTPIQLVWAQNVLENTNKPVLILTPIAVAAQTIREGDKFSIECAKAIPDKTPSGVVVTNYEQLHHYDWRDFSGVVCDESSVLKSFAGQRRADITAFMRKIPYRLLCTATAAPNDSVELGTSSEALGYLGHTDMLGKFFKNDQGNIATGRQWGSVSKWRLKGHAEEPFWRWVCSWARAVRKPSDLGYSDDRFTLPGLDIRETVVDHVEPLPGMLFHTEARGLQEQRREQKATLEARCETVARLVDHDQPAVAWCHLNAEGDLLESMIPDAEQVSGSDSDEEKERKLMGFADGDIRVLMTKPKIGAFGLNWQHCAHHTYFPSHSFEQWYQAVRRSWRFGQTRDVTVDIVSTPGSVAVLENLQRKATAADEMFDRMVRHMADAMVINRSTYNPLEEAETPRWLAQ